MVHTIVLYSLILLQNAIHILQKFAPGVDVETASSSSSLSNENVSDCRDHTEASAVADPDAAIKSTTNNRTGNDEIDLEGQQQQGPHHCCINNGHGEASEATEFDVDDDDALDISQQCAICLERFQPDEEICCSHNKNCAHRFHRPCISAWLLKHEDCPCCRRNYLDFESCGDSKGAENEEENAIDDHSGREIIAEADRGEYLTV